MNTQRQTFSHAVTLVRVVNGGDLLVAAYGSLPLKPEPGLMPFGAGVIRGYRKALCIGVTGCRGTSEHEGRVAGLIAEAQAETLTMVLRAEHTGNAGLLERLARRELDGLAYDARPLLCDMHNGIQRVVLGFAAAPDHTGFRQDCPDVLARIVAKAHGSCGTNLAYLDMILEFEQSEFGKTTPELQRLRDRIENGDGTYGRRMAMRGCRADAS